MGRVFWGFGASASVPFGLTDICNRLMDADLDWRRVGHFTPLGMYPSNVMESTILRASDSWDSVRTVQQKIVAPWDFNSATRGADRSARLWEMKLALIRS